MVRFHLFGLVAVALAIQAPPLALAIQGPPAFESLDSRCRDQADQAQHTSSSLHREGTCASLKADFVADEYALRCQCGGQDWWAKYQKCLDAHRNSWLKNDISKDKKKRCTYCKSVYEPYKGGDSNPSLYGCSN